MDNNRPCAIVSSLQENSVIALPYMRIVDTHMEGFTIITQTRNVKNKMKYIKLAKITLVLTSCYMLQAPVKGLS